MRAGVAVGVLAGALLLGAAGVGRAAAACPEAQRHQDAGDHPRAEEAARACLAHAPDDAETTLLLARVLAWQRRYGEAQAITDRMLLKHPTDGDWLAFGARLAFWRGDLEGAWAAARTLPAATLADPETARFLADLAWFREDWPEAERRYTALMAGAPADADLLRRRGRAREAQGRLAGAEEDYSALCEAPGGACLPLHELKRRTSRLTLSLQTGYAAVQGARDSWNLFALADVKAAEFLQLGLSVDSRWRDTDRELLHDAYIEGAAHLHFRRWAVRGAVGFTPRPDFSPAWAARVEPSLAFDFGLQLALSYAWLGYEEAPAHVLSPAVAFESGRAEFTLRYYLSVDDAARVGHAVMGKVGYSFNDLVRAHAGAAWGDRTDYLSLTDRRDAAVVTAFAGTWLDLDWQHRITADYIYRFETAAGRRYHQHDVLLGYRVRF